MTCEADAGPVPFCPLGELRDLIARVRDRRVTLMGLGVFGGGEGAARFLVEHGARLTVTDLKPEHKLTLSLERL